MMYKLIRDFYHKICGELKFYGKAEDNFKSCIDARDFIYATYRNNYTIIEDPNSPFHITLTSNLVQVECYIQMQ